MGQQGVDFNRVAFTTLGCKVNQYESEALKSLFHQNGYQVVDFAEQADVYVINTCTVTHLGNRKSRQMIRRAVNSNPDAVVAVTGCYAQTAPGEVLAIPGVDLVIGTSDRRRIVELVEEARKSQEPINAVRNIMEAGEFEEISVLESEHRTRAFIKIQEGCNNYCSYCIIPFARGPLRSRKPERVIEEAERLCTAGFQEIVLTGICIGTYGRDLGQVISLAGLVRKLIEIPGLTRLRLGSVEPTDITPDLVEVVADSPQVCKHLHIPLQSGSDVTLQAMNRRYNTMEYAKLVGYLRYMIPDLAVTTDVIVGFPGEEEEHFLHTLEFVEEMEFAALHVFKYSTRKGTASAELPDNVPPELKESRSRQLIKLGKDNAREFARNFIGQTMDVLVEQRVDDAALGDYPDAGAANSGESLYEGLTGNYLRVIFKAREQDRGCLVKVALEGFQQDALRGCIIDQ
ncbi:MAG: tRNA (N(6)-L-threonylcarbamoyladenosine(37)-C(2))-methylthiotransferase MtaB [Clostridia bacterium]|nr:tRNA (N(6)-L-threonylcarbamoyladenosine(37)-C(2))-methylthiotransferase MtaB [Clostridia bacterium]